MVDNDGQRWLVIKSHYPVDIPGIEARVDSLESPIIHRGPENNPESWRNTCYSHILASLVKQSLSLTKFHYVVLLVGFTSLVIVI